jgi:hypothetical protein
MPDGHRNRALERLRTEAARLRVTLTSRPEQYMSTIEAGEDLPYAAVIELRPVGPKAAARYLLDGQTDGARQAW